MKKPSLPKRKKKQAEAPSRITNETVAEHRERILAGGRKFKYPRQYLRHKLVMNAIIIGSISVIVAAGAIWWLLYPRQNTSEFMYRLTQVLPLPVAYVDGVPVRYSDYLMQYRSQEYWLQNQGQLINENGDQTRQLDYVKRNVLDTVIAETYAKKLAPSVNVSVTDKDVDTVMNEIRHMSNGYISQSNYDASVKSTLNYSRDENRHILELSLTRQKVAFAVDKPAQETKASVQEMLDAKDAPSLEEIADKLNKESASVRFSASGFVPKDNQDGGLAKAAMKLKKGQVSSVIESTRGDDGYCFVEYVDSDAKQISYKSLCIPLTVFQKKLDALKNQHKIDEFIDIAEVKTITKEEK